MKILVIGDYYIDPKPDPAKLNVKDGTSLRKILQMAKERGLRFGYGVLTIDSVAVKIEDIDTPVHTVAGKDKVEIKFREEVPPQAFDLESIL